MFKHPFEVESLELIPYILFAIAMLATTSREALWFIGVTLVLIASGILTCSYTTRIVTRLKTWLSDYCAGLGIKKKPEDS